MSAAEERDTILVGLVEEALRAHERGERVDPRALCAPWPHLEAALEEALSLCGHLDALQLAARADELPPVNDALVGKVIEGRYELRRRIGMGAMGAVFEAQDLVLARTVAVKVLDPVLFRGEAGRERFAREARAIASLRHPGIVVIHDHGGGDLPFLVMDLVPGLDLAALLTALCRRARAEWPDRRIQGSWFADAFRELAGSEGDAAEAAGTAPSEDATWDHPYASAVAGIVLQVARGLAAAHAQGVLHRDVKPSNVLLRPDGTAVLVDFGLARLPGERTLTAGGGPLGTPWYMAPEQAGGGHTVSHAADIYALGSTLYHLIALRPPFEDDPARVLLRIQHEDPLPLRKIAPGVPRDLAVICEKAMEKRPADRYRSAGEMAEDLEAFLDLRAISVSPPSPVTRLARKVRRRPARAAAFALLALLIPVAGFAWSRAQDARILREASVLGEKRLLAAELARTVPPLVCVEGDARRNLLELNAKDTEALELLSEILALDPAQRMTRLFRATLLLDGGKTAAGLADLSVLKQSDPGSTGLAVLIERLEGMAPGTLWTVQLPIDPAPAAATALDHFVLGFSFLRAAKGGSGEHARRALAELGQALERDPQMHEARDLRLLAYLMNRRWYEALTEAHRLEGIYGGRHTARTRHVIAAACLGLGLPAVAIPAAEESLRLRPGRHGPLHNLGVAKYQLGAYPDALVCFEEAIKIRPELFNSSEMLVKTLRGLGRYDDALAAAERIPTDTNEGRWRRALNVGNVYLDQALKARSEGDLPKTRAFCATAKPFIDEALAIDPAQAATKTSSIAVSTLGDEDLSRALGPLLDAISVAKEDDPVLLRYAGLLLFSLPGTDPQVALCFLHRAHSAAPADPEGAYWLARKLLDECAPREAARVMLETLAGLPLPKHRELAREVVNALPSDDALRDELRALARKPVPGRRSLPAESRPTQTPMSKR